VFYVRQRSACCLQREVRRHAKVFCRLRRPRSGTRRSAARAAARRGKRACLHTRHLWRGETPTARREIGHERHGWRRDAPGAGARYN